MYKFQYEEPTELSRTNAHSHGNIPLILDDVFLYKTKWSKTRNKPPFDNTPRPHVVQKDVFKSNILTPE